MTGNSERRTQQWFKMVSPPGEARDDAWQVLAVARKLFDKGVKGLADKDGRWLFRIHKDGKEVPIRDWSTTTTSTSTRRCSTSTGLHAVQTQGFGPYSEYVKARGLRWPVVAQPDGTWRETSFAS